MPTTALRPTRRRSLRPAVWAATLLAVSAPAARAQQACRERCPFAPKYMTFSAALLPNTTETDIIVALGLLKARGTTGGWMGRVDGMAGISLYTTDPSEFGALLGSQLAIMRMISGDYLMIGDFRTEVFLLGGGGAYWGWHLAETPDESNVVPVVSLGAGVRLQDKFANRNLIMLELFREERIGEWASKWFLRLTVAFPRGRSGQ